jgi:hypothetical protein
VNVAGLLLGEIALDSFVILVITRTFLAMFFHGSSARSAKEVLAQEETAVPAQYGLWITRVSY